MLGTVWNEDVLLHCTLTYKKHKSLQQTSIGNGGCGANMDWSDMLADYDGMEVNISIKI